MFKKIIAGAGIALVALFAAPAAAQAVYAPDESITVTGSPTPGGTVTVAIDAAFTPGEDVSFTLTGENASGTYTITATGLESGVVGTAAITVVAADGAGNGSGDDDGLAVTGGTAITTIWIAGGALALGAALLMIRSMRRKASV
jgi:hypothetical protein